MSRFDSTKLRERVSRMALRVANMARRVTVSSSKGGAWGFEGYSIPDLRGGSTTTDEGADYDETELFGGIGIFARPADGDNAEAVILQIGAEAEHPTIIAVRNEAARARYEAEFGELGKGAVVIFNSLGKARAVINADGSIELTPAVGQELVVKRAGGATDRLVTRSEFMKHGHPTAATGPVSGPSVAPAPSVDPAFPGTQALQSE